MSHYCIMFNVVGLRTPADDHAPAFAPNGDRVLSPSQLSTFNMCPRKWGARYLHGQHEPPNASAAAGKRMHTQLETYYNKRIVPTQLTPEGVWALALIAKGDLPLPGPGVVAERRFEFEYDGVSWRGSKDLTYDRDGWRVIRDHKSTSQLNPLWVKTEKTLRTDPQSVIYAMHEYECFVVTGEVRNEWGYVTRQAHPQVLVVRVDMPREDVVEAMVAHTATGKRMLALYREKPEINDLPPDGTTTGGCEAFGGCKVVGCNVTTLDRIRGRQVFIKKKEGADMGFLDDLRAKQAVKAAISQPTPAGAMGADPPPAAVPPATPPASVPAGTWVAGPAAPTAPVLGAAPVTVQLGGSSGTTTVRERLAAVVPPPFTPPVTVPAEAFAAGSVVTDPGATVKMYHPDEIKVSVAGIPVNPPPAKRGRKRNAVTTTVVDPAVAGRQHTVPPREYPSTVVPPATFAAQALGRTHHVSPTPQDYPGEAAPTFAQFSTDGYTLCVNCCPLGEPVVLYSRYVAQVHEAITASHGVALYSLIPYEGTAIYQDALRQMLEQAPPAGYLVVDSRSAEGRDALPTLERHAHMTIRGF